MVKPNSTLPLGELHQNGTVVMTKDGLDVLRAIFLGGLATCEAGIARARDMIRHTGDPVIGRQTLAYYTNAAKFLRHMLGAKIRTRMRMAQNLTLLRHPAIQETDPSAETLTIPGLEPEGMTDESGIPVGQRSGSNGVFLPEPATQQEDGGGSTVPGEPDTAGHRSDATGRRKPSRRAKRA